MDADWKSFEEAVQGGFRTRTSHGLVHYDGQVAGNRVVAVKMGSGCVTTAIAAARLLALVRCDLAFSVGPVGSLTEDLKPATLCQVERVIPWQTLSDDGEGGTVKALDWPRIPEVLGVPVLSGLRAIGVASGELFVDKDSVRSRLYSRTGCEAVDMNLFGLLRVLEANKVPSLHLRLVSDRAGDGAGEEFRRFLDQYNGEGGRKMANWVKALPPDETSPSQYSGLEGLLLEAERDGQQEQLK